MKTCCSCKVSKDDAEFSKASARKDGLQCACKDCNKITASLRDPAYMAAYKEKNRGTLNAYQRWYKYGLSSEDFKKKLAEQGGACAICRDTDKKWCVDHCHTTGKVRSILCYCCNIAIGNLADSARLATAAAEYLTKHGNL